MANPYKKAESAKKTPPVYRQDPVVQDEVIVEEKAPVVAEVSPAPATEDILAGMLEQKRKSKSYAFYLDEDVVNALDQLAKQKKSNKSKVLNTLLRNLLLK